MTPDKIKQVVQLQKQLDKLFAASDSTLAVYQDNTIGGPSRLYLGDEINMELKKVISSVITNNILKIKSELESL